MSRIASEKVRSVEKDYKHRWYLKNKAKVLRKSSSWKKLHPERVRCINFLWRNLNKTRLKKYHHYYSLNNREKYHVFRRNYRKKYPDKVLAHCAINNAVCRNKIPKAAALKCLCGKNAMEYHHYAGYSKEHRLDVEPLCLECHMTETRGG